METGIQCQEMPGDGARKSKRRPEWNYRVGQAVMLKSKEEKRYSNGYARNADPRTAWPATWINKQDVNQ